MKPSAIARSCIISLLAVIALALLVPACSQHAVKAADTFFPDFEQLTGEIPGFPISPGPVNVNRGGDFNKDSIDDYLNLSVSYSDGSDRTMRGFELFISYIPVTTYLFPEGLTESVARESHYTSSGSRDIAKLEQMREYDNFRELELENTAPDRFSVVYYNGNFSTYGSWWGRRIFTYQNNYIIRMEGNGPGWESDTQFLNAFNLAEQYARDAITSLSGGITLRHYNPLEYLALTTDSSYDPRPAGNLVATVTGENGKPVKGEYVLFYVPSGSLLASCLNTSGDVPPFNVSAVLGEDAVVLGHAITDSNGVATLNYLTPSLLVNAEQFSAAILHQRFLNDNNNINGEFHVAVIDMKNSTATKTTAVSTEYNGIAKIVRITGNGRTDEFKEAYLKQYPDSPTWGPGKVRVKRAVALPAFDYTPVEPGFILMPGDIIDIDGDVEAEIAWVTGDRAIARVPDKVVYGDTEVRTPHSRLVLSTSSYDSGFLTTWDKIQGGIFGFSLGQGLDVLSGIHPIATGIKKGTEFSINVYDAIKEADFTSQTLMIKIRLRSVVRVNTTGEETVIQTYEGSPDVLTVTGGTATLGEREMVSIDAAGTMSEVSVFNAKNDTPEWFDTATAWEDDIASLTKTVGGSVNPGEDSGGSFGGSMGIIIGVVATVVIIVGGVLLLLRRKK